MSIALHIQAITDLSAHSLDAHVAAYRALCDALPAGAFSVQLRAHHLAAAPLIAAARALLSALEGRAPLVVNDRLDVALALGLRRVHLGRGSVSVAEARSLLGPGALVQVACHSPAEVARAEADGADAALLSPIYPSPGKGPPLGPTALAEARALAPRVTLLALGGVDAGSLDEALAHGASGAAVIRAALDGSLSAALLRRNQRAHVCTDAPIDRTP